MIRYQTRILKLNCSLAFVYPPTYAYLLPSLLPCLSSFPLQSVQGSVSFIYFLQFFLFISVLSVQFEAASCLPTLVGPLRQKA